LSIFITQVFPSKAKTRLAFIPTGTFNAQSELFHQQLTVLSSFNEQAKILLVLISVLLSANNCAVPKSAVNNMQYFNTFL
jgi:hypothetical protein